MVTPPGDGQLEPPRLRLSNRSVVVAVLIVGLALMSLQVLAETARVLGWVAVAVLAAALLHPFVRLLSRRIPRPLALLAVVITTLGAVGGLVYAGFDDLETQARRLEREAPEAARRIERSERFGEAAGEIGLAERVEQFVEELPGRLQGGEPAEALRSAATRGVAFLATGVLTLFVLLHGPGLLDAGIEQVRDGTRRRRIRTVIRSAYWRAWRYIVLTLGRAAVAGMVAVGIAEVIDVPGHTLLGLWMAAFSIIPLVGVVIGSIPVVLLSFALDPGDTLFVLAAFVAYQALEVYAAQRRLEAASLHVGPVVTLVAAMFGFELYGIGGLLVTVGAAVFAVAVVRELGAEGDLVAAVDGLLPGDEPSAPATRPATAAPAPAPPDVVGADPAVPPSKP